MQYTCNVMHRYAKINDFPIDFAIFTKAVWTNRLTDQPTDRPTNQWTNQRTNQQMDMPSYRDAIAASKKQSIKKNPHYGHCSATALPQPRPLSKRATANVKQNQYKLRK